MVRARAIVDLADALEADLERRGGSRLLRDVELPLTTLLAEMERTGIAADVDWLAELEARFAGEVKRVADEAYSCVGREFNLGSPKQLQEILFDELKLPKTKKIKTGYTTDADALAWLVAQTDHPLHRPPAAAPRRVAAEDGRRLADPDGRRHRAHPHHVQPDGRGDRAGCPATDPNLQNIPIRTAEGRRDPQGVHRRRRLRGADDRRLLARSRCGSWRTCPGTRA